MSDLVFYTPGQAQELLNVVDGRVWATTEPVPGIVITAAWSYQDVVDLLGRAIWIQEAGPRACGAGFGIAVLSSGSDGKKILRWFAHRSPNE